MLLSRYLKVQISSNDRSAHSNRKVLRCFDYRLENYSDLPVGKQNARWCPERRYNCQDHPSMQTLFSAGRCRDGRALEGKTTRVLSAPESAKDNARGRGRAWPIHPVYSEGPKLSCRLVLQSVQEPKVTKIQSLI